jgi:hypothetical protein
MTIVGSDGEEKRKSPRLPYREDIIIEGAKRCTCSDISEGGIFVSSIQTFDEGEMIDITITLAEEQITVKGQIKYCQPGIGAGIMFHNLSDEHKVKIKTLADRLSSNNS